MISTAQRLLFLPIYKWNCRLNILINFTLYREISVFMVKLFQNIVCDNFTYHAYYNGDGKLEGRITARD